MIGKLNLDRTREALAEYDQAKPHRDKAWDKAETSADVNACVAADAAALTKVREAFALDTADRNSHDNVMITTLDFIRSLL
jgi:hypothetical protein